MGWFSKDITYDSDLVNESIESLKNAKKELSQTAKDLQTGADKINNAKGFQEYIGTLDAAMFDQFASCCEKNIETLYLNIEQKAEEIEEYNNSSGWDKFWGSVGMGVTKIGEGFLSVGENILDAGATVVGFVGGFVNKDFKDSVGEFVKKDHVGDFFADQYENGALRWINAHSNFSHDSAIASGFKVGGEILGYVALEGLTSGMLSVSSTAAMTGVAGAAGLGRGTQEGLQKGKTFNQAFLQGLGTGAKEAAVAFVAGKLGEKIKSAKASKAVNNADNLGAVEGAAEGAVEGAVGNAATPAVEGYYDPLTKIMQKGGNKISDVGNKIGEKIGDSTVATKASEFGSKIANSKVVTKASEFGSKITNSKVVTKASEFGSKIANSKVGSVASKAASKVINAPGKVVDVASNVINKVPAAVAPIGKYGIGAAVIRGKYVDEKSNQQFKSEQGSEAFDAVNNSNIKTYQENLKEKGVMASDDSTARWKMDNVDNEGQQPTNTDYDVSGADTSANETDTTATTDNKTSSSGSSNISSGGGGGGFYSSSPSTPVANATSHSSTPKVSVKDTSSKVSTNAPKTPTGGTTSSTVTPQQPAPSTSTPATPSTPSPSTPSSPSTSTPSTSTPASDNSVSTPATSTQVPSYSNTGSTNSHYSGGGYSSSEGFIPSTQENPTDTSSSIIDDVIGESTTSIDDVIKGNSYNKIETSSTPLSSISTSSSKGSNYVIPIAAGLSAAGAAGIGAKIYMDNKNNNDNGESDEITTEDWSGEDTLNIEYDNNEPEENYLDDDDYGYTATSNEEIEKYNANNNEEALAEQVIEE